MRASQGFLLGSFLVGSLLAAAPSPARAYVRSRATSCKAVYWAQSCIYVQADSTYVKDMAAADIEQAIQNAIGAWQTRTLPTGFITLKYLPADGPKDTTYKDGLQVIKFRADTWCRPATDGAAQVCYDASATAITTVSYINKAGDAKDGQIVDADIELNAVNNHFFNYSSIKDVPSSDQRNPADLWNTLTHEMGHMQGLDHTCRGASESATDCSVDDTGAARPLCSLVARQRTTVPAYQAIYDTTMYAIADPAEIRKRIPQTDDVKGITDSYPASSDPKSCLMPGATAGGGGCTMSMGSMGSTAATSANGTLPGSRTGQVLGLGAAGLVLGLLGRRRLRRTAAT